jgi:aspartyl/glutamyl-tRNA(Asn/Gln) amidotransferase C subunit
MAIDRETVKHVAVLARLAMTDAELDRFTEQLRAILDYIGKLNELDTSAVEPLSHALALTNVFRPDEPAGEPGRAAEGAGRRETSRPWPSSTSGVTRKQPRRSFTWGCLSAWSP